MTGPRPLVPYVLAGVGIFAFIVLCCWTSQMDVHELIYLLGSRRIADPAFLAADFTWKTLSPTTALYDHMVARLWPYLDAFAIVHLGRLVTWAAFAASFAFLAHAARIPAWSALAGFAVWLLCGQTLAECGLPFEGFQPKSFAYPLLFTSLGLALGGRTAWAGACAGLATAFHLVVGGWGFFAVGVALLLGSGPGALRRAGLFVAAAVPFIAPKLFFVGRFHGGTMAEHALMDRIYVTFAMPHCCDPEFFMSPVDWVRLAVVSAITPVLVFAWRDERDDPGGAARRARMLGTFVTALLLLFVVAVVAHLVGLYGLLKLYPAQLASGLALLFLMTFGAAWLGAAPRRGLGGWRAALILAVVLGLAVERSAWRRLVATPRRLVAELSRPHWPEPPQNEPLYAWIREHSPRDAVFVTPFLEDFWFYAERAQVATHRHPPLDRGLIEWKERLEAMNGFESFVYRGFDVFYELDMAHPKLSAEHLARIRDRYGATHYLVKGERPDLARQRVHGASGYSVYELAGL